MSILIEDGRPVAFTNKRLKSGDTVKAAYSKLGNDLTSHFDAKISNAKKYNPESLPKAILVDDGYFIDNRP